MAIRRTRMTFEDHYTQIPNEWLRDVRLSLKARGLLAQLMTHQPGWVVSVAQLVRENPEGRDAIAGAVRELEQFGYLRREGQEHGDSGKFGAVPYVLTEPDAPLVDYPSTGEPSTGEPSTDNPHPKKTISSEDHVEEDHQSSSKIDAPGAREDVEAVCAAVAAHVEGVTGMRPKISKTWRRDARLMLDRDGHPLPEVLSAVSWVAGDGFWAANVLSPGKLRSKWPTLLAQARRRPRHRDGDGIDALVQAHEDLYGAPA